MRISAARRLVAVRRRTSSTLLPSAALANQPGPIETCHFPRRSHGGAVRGVAISSDGPESGAPTPPTLEALSIPDPPEALAIPDPPLALEIPPASPTIERDESEEHPAFPMVDQEVLDFITKLKAINPQTVKDDQLVEQVLEESLELLQQRVLQNNTTDASSQMALTRSMQQLLELWISMHFQASTTPQTSRPFQILISVWALAAPAEEAPNEAMQVLQRWYELLAGNIELAPTRIDFNQVLSAFAATCAHAVPDRDNPENRPLSETDVTSLATSAFEFVQEINASGYTADPGASVLETNAHVVQCLSSAIRVMAPITKDNLNMCKAAWYKLQRTMTDEVMPIVDKMGASQKTGFFGGASSDEGNPRGLFFLQQALGDALMASITVTKARSFGNDIILQEDWVGDSKNYSKILYWQVWGTTFNDTLLDNSDRLLAVLEYAGELQRGADDDDKPMPTAFQHLSYSCEAWHNLLRFYNGAVDPKAVGTEMHRIIEKLHALGQQYASDTRQHLEVHRILLKHYVAAIKQWEFAKDNNEQIPQQDELLHQLEERHWNLFDQYVVQDQEGMHRLNIEAPASLSEEGEKYKQHIQQMLTSSFNALMNAKYTVGKVDEPLNIWRAMRQLDLPCDRHTYGAVLKSLADSTDGNAANVAMDILGGIRAARIEKLPGAISPDHTHYASVLVAWSHSRQKNAAQSALQVFDWFMQHRKAKFSKYEKNPDGPDPRSMLRLEPIHFSALLTTLGRHRGGEPWLNSAKMDAAQSMVKVLPPKQRNALVTGAAINALKFVATAEAVELAQQLFEDLCLQYATTKQESMRPTEYHYGLIMHTWARAAAKGHAKNAQEKVEGLLLQLESEYLFTKDPSLRPNAIIYQALINSINAVGGLDAGERANRVLKMMEEKADQGLAADYPGELMYNRVLEAHKNAKGEDCGERAEAVLDKMKHAYSEKGHADAMPRTEAYRNVIQAWSFGNNPDKARHGQKLLRELKDIYINEGDLLMQPEYWAYTAVLKCCSHTPLRATPQQRQEAVRIALETLVEMEQEIADKTSPFVYSSVIRTIHRHSTKGPEKEKLANAVFEKCVKKGLVDDKVISALQECSPGLYRRIPRPLPPRWSENLKNSTYRGG